jgi:hypothetical protein
MDEKHAVVSRIIGKTDDVANLTQELGLQIVHSRRENVGGVQIDSSLPSFREGFAEKIVRSLIQIASLRFHQA